MLMSPNKGETAVHGCHCPDDKAMRMHEVLTRPWVGVCVPLALNLSIYISFRYLPLAVFRALMLVGLSKRLKQIIQIKLNKGKNPNWPEANQLVFTSMVEDLNSGLR